LSSSPFTITDFPGKIMGRSAHDMVCRSGYNDPMSLVTSKSSTCYRVLVERVGELGDFEKGLTKKEFNEYCAHNQFFRNDLLLDLRDIVHIAEMFVDNLTRLKERDNYRSEK